VASSDGTTTSSRTSWAVGFASLVGLIDNLAGRVELDPFLAERAWEAPVG
jgi:hypothetical protein